MNFLHTSSFYEYLRKDAPQLLTDFSIRASMGISDFPHSTTIIAVEYSAGVILVADRRATIGTTIASHSMEKIFIIDDTTAVGFAGTAAIAMDLVRLFAVEIEHYEKIEGKSLSFAGKANKLATMINQHFTHTPPGCIALPLLVGIDNTGDSPTTTTKVRSKIVSFDVLGGKYVEHGGYYAIGSGAVYARNSLKKIYSPDSSLQQALHYAVTALEDASQEDAATGGINECRDIYPLAIAVNATHAHIISADEIEKISRKIIKDYTEQVKGKISKKTHGKTSSPKNSSSSEVRRK